MRQNWILSSAVGAHICRNENQNVFSSVRSGIPGNDFKNAASTELFAIGEIFYKIRS